MTIRVLKTAAQAAVAALEFAAQYDNWVVINKLPDDGWLVGFNVENLVPARFLVKP